MKKSFPSYYQPSEKEFKELWENCMFVLDANVLLNLYRYPKSAMEDLFKVFNVISSRLWIPHQVALEYQRNRLNVIAEQIQKYDKVKSILEKLKSETVNEFNQLQLKKRHSSINPDVFLSDIEKVINGFSNDLEKSEKGQPDFIKDDELRNRIDKLFDGKVGHPPKNQEVLQKIYDEGITRYEQKIPPGYQDNLKSKPTDKESSSFICNGLMYKKEFGDLILWNQIMNEAKNSDWKGLIIITDDEKEDWWWIVETKGKKIIGPRPELIEEITTNTGIKSFYLYNSERFLQYANKYLNANVEEESIDQVREIAELNRLRNAIHHRSPKSTEILQAVYEWLATTHPNDEIYYADNLFADIIRVNLIDGDMFGYWVNYVASYSSLHFWINNRLEKLFEQGLNKIAKGELFEVKIVLILSTRMTDEGLKTLMKPKYEIPKGVQLIIGKLVFVRRETKLHFVPMHSS